MRRLSSIIKKQKELLNYKKGNVLLIHIPLDKTGLSFKKRRLNFDELAVFENYHHGNAQVKLLNETLIKQLKTRWILLPIFYTYRLSNSLNELPEKYIKYFNQK
jgi:hypothetical protein